MKLLSRSEEVVLLSIWKLQDNAYGPTIRKLVSETTNENWTIGAIYPPLHRLHKKGFLKTTKSEPVAERGGRSKVFYTLTEEGKRALLKYWTPVSITAPKSKGIPLSSAKDAISSSAPL